MLAQEPTTPFSWTPRGSHSNYPSSNYWVAVLNFIRQARLALLASEKGQRANIDCSAWRQWLLQLQLLPNTHCCCWISRTCIWGWFRWLRWDIWPSFCWHAYQNVSLCNRGQILQVLIHMGNSHLANVVKVQGGYSTCKNTLNPAQAT